MTKHAKEKKLKRVLGRPSPLDAFPLEEKQKWAETLQKILDKDILLKEDRFLLQYAQAICRFRLATITSEDTAPFWEKINNLADKGHSLGFSQEDLLAINLIFRDKGKVDLELHCQLLGVKLGDEAED